MELLRSARARVRASPPWVADGILAVVLAVLHLGLVLGPASPFPQTEGTTVALVVAMTLLTTLPVAVRRTAPDVTLSIVGLGMVGVAGLGLTSPGFGLIVALYSYAAHTTKDDAAIVLGVFAAFTVLSLLLSGGITFLPLNLVVFATAWVLGDRQRVHRQHMTALQRRADALERERAVTAQLASALERTRIAEELHDVVAHGVTAMVTQAAGAERLLRADVERSRAALQEAARAGRASLAELRRLLGLLRAAEGPGGPAAPPADRSPRAVAAVPAGEREPEDRHALDGVLRWSRGRSGDVLLVLVIILVDVSVLLFVPVEAVPLPGYSGFSWSGVALVVLGALPLLWRRRHPLVVLGVVIGVGLIALAVPIVTQQLGTLAALYTVASRCSRRVSLTALWVLVAGIGVLWLTVEAMGPLPVQLVVLTTCWLLGDGQRARVARAQALTERTGALLADRERTGELAIVEERARIARELHDVVAHSVGVMVVQAEAAARVLPRDERAAATAIAQVLDTGRRTLTELRHVLGVFRDGATGAGAAYAPQPGLAALPDLMEGLAATSLHVSLQVDGTPSVLPSGVDLSAYRIIQESLTNVLRHADAASAEVRLTWLPTALRVTVADDGRGPLVDVGAAAVGGGGHGLAGMRERAFLVGGDLSAGVRPGGGFLVTATLPLEDPR